MNTDYDTQPPPTSGTTTSTTEVPHARPGSEELAYGGINPWSIIIFSAFLLFFGVLALIGRDSSR